MPQLVANAQDHARQVGQFKDAGEASTFPDSDTLVH